MPSWPQSTGVTNGQPDGTISSARILYILIVTRTRRYTDTAKSLARTLLVSLVPSILASRPPDRAPLCSRDQQPHHWRKKVLRESFKTSFEAGEPAPWPCPHCGKQVLLAEKNNVTATETRDSRDARRHEDWEPEWIEERFTSTLTCQNCGEIVVAAGKTNWEPQWDYDEGHELWGQVLSPSFMEPAPPIFTLSNYIPQAIRNEIRLAFALFWVDSSACANRIRSTVELMLNELRVARFAPAKKGSRRRRLSLHARIQKLPAKHESARKFLMALKWTGNDGSHAGEVLTREDTLDGFDLLAHVSKELWDPHPAALAARATEVNRKKGVKKPRP